MIIHVHVKPPFDNLFGLINIDPIKGFEISIDMGASFEDLLKQIALKYPKFQSFIGPDNNKISKMLIVVDGVVITSIKLNQINLHDQSTVSFLVQYSGG
jgi:hypothetical protein